jgi:hypothetical protein
MSYFATNEITGNTVAAVLLGLLAVRRPVPIPDDVGTVLALQARIDFASGVNPALNDVVELCVLPAECSIVDWILSGDQFDSNAAPLLALSIGVMTGAVGDASRTSANFAGTAELANAMPFGKGVVASPQFLRDGLFQTFANQGTLARRVAPSTTVDRSIGLFIQAAAATNPATVRRLDFTLMIRASRFGA